MSRRPRLRTRTAVATVVATLAFWATASPAAAHAGDAERATNYQTTIIEAPELPGLSISLGDAGSTIEITYEGPGEVVVPGYGIDPEPYLRIGPEGVFRNLQSNATYLNDSLTADTPIPPGVDPRNPPEWEQVSTGSTYSWHDHRSHWMGVVDPPAVAASPGEAHVVIEDWVIPLTVDGRAVEIRGNVSWVPGPRPWPWVASIVVGAGAAAALALLTRAGLSLEAGLLAGLGCSSLVLGYRLSPVAPPTWWLVGVVSAISLLGVAVLELGRGHRRVGTALAGLGGLASAGLIGFVDRAWLVRSLLPVEVHPSVGRAVVAGSLVLGGGLLVASVAWLLGPGRSGRPPTMQPSADPSPAQTRPPSPGDRADPRLARS